MDIIFYKADDDPDPWVAALANKLPQARIRIWQPGDDAHADYALVWKPPVALLNGRTGLKAVFNLGAGVDAILGVLRQHPDALPGNTLLVKIDDAGMGLQMTHYVMQAVLRHFRRMDAYRELKAARSWRPLPPYTQADYPIGILGLGALGAKVAGSLHALGFTVRGWSRTAKRLDDVQCYSGQEQLAPFLQGLRVVVNMLPLTAETENILDRRLFSQLAQGAKLINVARGAHLVEADLLAALDSGQLSSATLDVFRSEPLPSDHPFWDDDRIEITPHIAAETLLDESIAQIADKIAILEKGGHIGGIVDRHRSY